MAENPTQVPMKVQLCAGDVLVAEVDNPQLFSAVLGAILRQHPAYLPVPVAQEPSHGP